MSANSAMNQAATSSFSGRPSISGAIGNGVQVHNIGVPIAQVGPGNLSVGGSVAFVGGRTYNPSVGISWGGRF